MRTFLYKLNVTNFQHWLVIIKNNNDRFVEQRSTIQSTLLACKSLKKIEVNSPWKHSTINRCVVVANIGSNNKVVKVIFFIFSIAHTRCFYFVNTVFTWNKMWNRYLGRGSQLIKEESFYWISPINAKSCKANSRCARGEIFYIESCGFIVSPSRLDTTTNWLELILIAFSRNRWELNNFNLL